MYETFPTSTSRPPLSNLRDVVHDTITAVSTEQPGLTKSSPSADGAAGFASAPLTDNGAAGRRRYLKERAVDQCIGYLRHKCEQAHMKKGTEPSWYRAELELGEVNLIVVTLK